MKEKNELLEYKTKKLEKILLNCIIFLIHLIIIYLTLKKEPPIHVDKYDKYIFRITNLFKYSSFIISTFFVLNFNIKEKIPTLKIKKWLLDTFGFVIIFALMIGCSSIVNNKHSQDYKIRYKEYVNHSGNDNPDSQSGEEDNKNEEQNSTKLIKIHYIDVGQGDSIFIELPNKKTMLIDAGEASKGKIVADYITNLKYFKIDYIVATHPHTDHIGGLAHIINNFEIGKIYMPKANSTSKTYENLLNTISQKGLKPIIAKANINIETDENLIINILGPNKEYKNLNDCSAIIKISYANRKFLFMGDAETKSEEDITTDISADVIKVGHHGSDTSSSYEFINKVKAKYAIIMVGNNNKYKHPYQIIIDRWTNSGAKVYRTDINGNITVTSNGENIEIKTSK